MKHALNIGTPLVIGVLFACWCADHHFGVDADTYVHKGIALLVCAGCSIWLIVALCVASEDL